MKRVTNPKTLFESALKVSEVSAQPPNRGFFGGLISSADERDQRLAKTFIRSALQSPKLKGDAIALIGSGSLQAVISLLQSGDIKPWQCQNLGLSRVRIKELIAILRELERHGNDGLWSILDVVGMYLYDGTNTATKELIALVKRVLVTPALMNAVRNNMDGYHMQQMVERLAKLGAIDEAYATKLAKQVMRICRQGTDRVFYDLDDPVRKILDQLVALHPKATWTEVAKKLTSNLGLTAFMRSTCSRRVARIMITLRVVSRSECRRTSTLIGSAKIPLPALPAPLHGYLLRRRTNLVD